MTYSRGQGMAQILLSDMLGNHRIYINTEMEVDLKLDYLIEYHYLPKRLDWYFDSIILLISIMIIAMVF